MTFYYGPNGQVNYIRDQGDRTWQFKYASTGMLQKIITPTKGERHYAYQPHQGYLCKASLLNSVKDSTKHRLLAVDYYQNGQVAAVQESIENKTYFTYDDDKNRVVRYEEENEKYNYYLDEYGLINRIQYPDDKNEYQYWQPKDRTVIKGNCTGLTHSYLYDKYGRLIEEHTDESTQKYSYAEGQRKPSILRSSKGVVHQEFDDRGNLTKYTDEIGNSLEYQYDSNGNITQITNNVERLKCIEYNDLDQAVAIIEGQGNKLSCEYDIFGREHKVVDAEGRTIIFYYYDDDAISEIKDENESIHFQYDAEGQLLCLTNAQGYKTQYRYNNHRQLIAIKNPSDQIKIFKYNENAQLAEIIREDESVVRYSYEDNGLTLIEHIGNMRTRYQFDSNGRLVAANNNDHHLQFSYNTYGQLEEQYQNDEVVSTSYSKDQRISLNYLDQTVLYQHDKINRLTRVRVSDKYFIEQQFNASSQVIQRDYPNQQQELKTYSALGELTEIESGGYSFKYKYDKTGLITAKNDIVYQYDNSCRLIQASDTNYEHDPLGNLVQVSDKATNNDQQWIYNPCNNQLVENATQCFRYDAFGNLTKKIDKESGYELEYQYNLKQQLIRVFGKRYDQHEECWYESDIHFQYDALGRRIEKRTERARYEYLYDRFNIVAILVYNGEEKPHLVSITHDEATDTPLSITSKNGTFFYHRDHQGSILALSNEAGEIIEQLEYDNHYGTVIRHAQFIETYNPYGYTGREMDATDLYYYRARYYDPTIQRFISQDPLNFLGGDYNLYRYVGSDPVNYLDPMGLNRGSCSDKDRKKRQATIKKTKKPSISHRIASGARYARNGVRAAVAIDLVTPDPTDAALPKWLAYAVGGAIEEAVLGIVIWGLEDKVFNEAELIEAEAIEKECNRKAKAKDKENNKVKGKEKKQNCKNCPRQGKPVNPILGAKILSDEIDLDFSIQAPMPLIWQRNYASDNPRTGLYGQGWTTLADSHLLVISNQVHFIEPNGRALKFDNLEIGESSQWVVEQLILKRITEDAYHIITDDGTYLHFVQSNHKQNKYLLSSIADLNGNGLTYYYNQHQVTGHEDRLTHIVTDDQRLFELVYIDTTSTTRLKRVDELIQSSSDPNVQERTNWVTYGYDPEGNLISVTNHAGRITREFSYTNHIMVMHREPNGLESCYTYTEYSPQGKVLRNETSAGQFWTFEYYHQKTIVVDHDGRCTSYLFDEDNYLTGTIDALGQTTHHELNSDGLPDKIIDEAEEEKVFYYDRRGNAVLIKDTDGTSIQVSYHDHFNLPTQISDDLGHTTALEYDERGNLLLETQADGSQTQYEYNQQGWPIIITDAKEGKNTFRYDSIGNLIERIDCSQQSTRYQYDRHSNLTTITDPLGNATHYQYDNEQQLVSITYPNKSTESFVYNTLGQLIRYTNTEGIHTDYQLDIEGRPTKRVDSLGGELAYQYDTHGRLTALINENNSQYQFEYDPLNRLIKEQGLDGLTTAYQYDAIGNVIEKLENTNAPTPRKTHYLREKGGRLVEKFIASGKMHSRTRYQYDAIGQLIQARNDHSRIDLRYDALGRLHSESTTTEVGEHTIRHRYDELGNRIATTLPNGKTLNWLYYGSGHLHHLNLDGQLICDYERDELHRETYRSQGALHSTQAYDALGRLTEQRTLIGDRQEGLEQQHALSNAIDNLQKHLQPHNSGLKQQRRYQYSLEGELLQVNDHRHGVTRYQYDLLGRILQAQHKNLNEQFNFDPAHNIIPVNQEQHSAQNDSQNTIANPALAGPQGYIKNNRLAVFEDKRYSYDDFGNMIEKRIAKHTTMQFSYDAEHQMREAIINKNGVTQTYTYSYDPFGRRIAKKDSFNTTSFLWDGNRLLSETRGSRTKTYVYEQDGFIPVAQLIDYATSTTKNDRQPAHSELLYYHCDHLGTPKELSDVQGNFVWSAQYKAWGNTLTVEYPELDVKAQQTDSQRHVQNATLIEQWQDDFDQPLRFQGQYFDEETGLHYNRFRYYDPDVGRFVTQDPIGLLGGDNLYQYVANPTQWIDPFGLSSAKLDRALGGVRGDCKSAHHLIPEKIWKENENFLNSIGMGGMMDKASNGLLMPSKGTAGAISHTGSHPVYSAMVQAKLSAIEDLGMGPEESKKAVQKLQKKLRNQIKAKSPKILTKASKTSACKLA